IVLWLGLGGALVFHAASASSIGVATVPEKAYTMEHRLTHQDISQQLGLPYPLPTFKPDRTVDELKTTCTTWAIPAAPDPQSQEWYRAATTLDAIKLRTVEQHQQMLQLYEAAARRGHYHAVKNLTIWYTQGGLVHRARFKPDPDKARYWLGQAINKHRWMGALEWVPHIMGSQGSGLSKDDYKLAYLQAAADQGVALAQFQLALVYGNKLMQVEKEKALLTCAAQQGLSAALKAFAIYREISEFPQEAVELYQQAVMNGGEGGGQAAYALSSAVTEGTHTQEALKTPTDLIRDAAYYELNDALRDGRVGIKRNPFYRFPCLNEVLPLPPAVVTEWKGIYSAMSEEDAAYYQNPPPAEFYLKQVQEAGLLIPLEYLAQPYYPKEGESLF
ncbi:MAG: tetratricopeptide repeat protein, partial [Saezia sp.]